MKVPLGLRRAESNPSPLADMTTPILNAAPNIFFPSSHLTVDQICVDKIDRKPAGIIFYFLISNRTPKDSLSQRECQ